MREIFQEDIDFNILDIRVAMCKKHADKGGFVVKNFRGERYCSYDGEYLEQDEETEVKGWLLQPKKVFKAK